MKHREGGLEAWNRGGEKGGLLCMHILPCLSDEASIGALRKLDRVVGMEIIRA